MQTPVAAADAIAIGHRPHDDTFFRVIRNAHAWNFPSTSVRGFTVKVRSGDDSVVNTTPLSIAVNGSDGNDKLIGSAFLAPFAWFFCSE